MFDLISPDRQVFMVKILLPAFFSTLRMLIISVIISTLLGFILAILLVVTDQGGLHPNKFIYKILDFIINTVRSFPFIILLVAVLPFTKMLVGTSIGEKGAIVPLVIAATAFISRIMENGLQEVDGQLIEAAKSFGASDIQIIFKVMLVEALPTIISGVILATITVLGASAMAGAVGAGGLGAVALVYGYQSFNNDIMLITVIILMAMVQVIQGLGNFVYRKMK
jgi:D-methionine transport system permease protein